MCIRDSCLHSIAVCLELAATTGVGLYIHAPPHEARCDQYLWDVLKLPMVHQKFPTIPLREMEARHFPVDRVGHSSRVHLVPAGTGAVSAGLEFR
eukprot:8586184-Alexandrium_andersonii.AAC.1